MPVSSTGIESEEEFPDCQDCCLRSGFVPHLCKHITEVPSLYLSFSSSQRSTVCLRVPRKISFLHQFERLDESAFCSAVGFAQECQT